MENLKKKKTEKKRTTPSQQKVRQLNHNPKVTLGNKVCESVKLNLEITSIKRISMLQITFSTLIQNQFLFQPEKPSEGEEAEEVFDARGRRRRFERQ